MSNEKRLIWASDAQKAILKAPTFEVEYHGIKNRVLIPVVAEALIKEIPSVDAVEVVYCDNCVAHGSCVFEPVLHGLGYKKPFCCAGKMDGDGNG
jgi:hypothetical protein